MLVGPQTAPGKVLNEIPDVATLSAGTITIKSGSSKVPVKITLLKL